MLCAPIYRKPQEMREAILQKLKSTATTKLVAAPQPPDIQLAFPAFLPRTFASSQNCHISLENTSRTNEISRGHGPPGPPSRHDTDLRPPSESTPVSSFPDGVEVLHDCPDATIDICFVYGLTGNRDSTWIAKGKSKPWLETLLPLKLTNARILTYGYDAYIVQKPVASTNGLIDHAKNLLNDLSTDRACSNASSRPLVFIAHSLGGLVYKEAILLSRNNPKPHLRGIFDCTKGIIFLGTPHKGS
ncbi:hypothetical protein FAUST_11030 [Fusarium austroamericanum]|uniref:DUF676 domain-containing protein n=1 Tax=Fusarium austroamericanum TaxID=282268 RepID=A0AAN6BUT9_FUSAU|nr:hypothetical protein FAUST_11030 [Fusarium austroamericanum]